MAVRQQASQQPWKGDRVRTAAVGRVSIFGVDKMGAGTHFGTGSVVARGQGQALVLTNAHVVRGGTEKPAVDFGGRKFEGTVVAVDMAADLAAITIADPSVEPIPLRSNPPSPGEQLHIGGFGKHGKFEVAYGPFVKNNTANWFEVKAVVRSGDSGGPVLDSNGDLCGIVWGTDDKFTMTSTAVRLTCIKRFLQRVGNRIAWLAPNLPPRPREGSAPGSPVDRFGNRIVGSTIPIGPIHNDGATPAIRITVPNQPGGDGASLAGSGYCPPPRYVTPRPRVPKVDGQTKPPGALVELKRKVDALLVTVQDANREIAALKDAKPASPVVGPAGPGGTPGQSGRDGDRGPKGDTGDPGPAGQSVDIAEWRAALREELGLLKGQIKNELKRELKAEAVITITPETGR